MQHTTVLLQEAVEALALSPQDIVVDATYGAGGHAGEILKHLDEQGTYIGIDVDKTALENKPDNPHNTHIHLVNGNFKNITEILGSLHIQSVDAILADLGWRMEQFAAGGKGLSFMHDEPLLMTYGSSEEYPFTAYDIINEWEEETLSDIIYGYGEERFARRIAKEIVRTRIEHPINTTFELRDCILQAIPKSAQRGKTNPATKTFQAIRIAVNEELSVLEDFLKQASLLLSPGGRLAIITFHSLEDRIVKHTFKELANGEKFSLLTKKPQSPSREELLANPRARSAKLRVIQHNVDHEQSRTTM